MPTTNAENAVSSYRKDHIPELDGLRGIAVLLVLWVHLPMGALGESVAAFRTQFLPGNVGVDLFFVLSGFLITRILLVDRESRVPLRYFLMRRFLRIFPIYYLSIGLLWPRLDAQEITAAATYTSNYWFIFRETGCALDHTWSLAVEEHFYMLWPPVVAFLSPVASRRVLLFFVIPVAVLSSALGLLLGDFAAHRDAMIEFFLRSSTIRFFSLGLGALMAYHESWIRGSRVRAMGLIGGCVAVCWALSEGGLQRLGLAGVLGHLPGAAGEMQHFAHAIVPFSIPFGSAAAVLAAVAWTGTGSPQGALLKLPPLRWVGRISYGVYLYHYPIFTAGLWGPEPMTPSSVRVAGVLVLALGAATLSYFLIERPLLKMGSRFRGPGRGAGKVAPGEGGGAVEAVKGAAPVARAVVRTSLSAAFVWGMYELFNGGAAAMIHGLDRHFPRNAPEPVAALERTRLAAPLVLQWTEEWGAKLEQAAATAVGGEPAGAPAFFVLGITPGNGESMTGLFSVGRSFAARSYLDLTFLKDVARRESFPPGLVLTYLLSSAAGLRRGGAAVERPGGEPEDSDLRAALYGDWVAGAAVRMTAQGVFPAFSADDIRRVVVAARAAEGALEGTRPLGWGKPMTFRKGTVEQRATWFHRGYIGTGAATDAWTAPIGE